jgi:hypothetical protein
MLKTLARNLIDKEQQLIKKQLKAGLDLGKIIKKAVCSG